MVVGNKWFSQEDYILI